MTRIAIIGAGLIGRSWAFVFARAGMRVKVWDADPGVVAVARAEVAAMAETVRQAGGSDPETADVTALIEPVTDLADALAGADLVQESGPERLEVKLSLFADLDRLAGPETILASSSSALVASRFTADLDGRARCLIAHPVNPPHLVPIVELCPAPYTDPSVLSRAEAIYRAAGQVPATMTSELEGFVLNRLQAVLLAESLKLVADGIIDVQGLDDTVRHGLGRRWAFMGPLETICLNAPGGIADYMERYGPTMARLADMATRGEAYSRAAAEKIAAAYGFAGKPEAVRDRQAWRDRELAALDAHLRQRAATKSVG